MSEQAQTNGRPKPEIRGKVIAMMDEWRNNTGTFAKREIIVDIGYNRSTPIKVTFRNDHITDLDGITEGDCVIIPYVLNGREYDGRYYVDIVGMGLQKITGATERAKQNQKPVLGCTAATAIETWAKYHGDDKPGFAEFCKAQKPGKASKAYTIGDWADIVNAIEAAQNAAAEPDDGATDPEDLPF